jgi:hypothetical protein
MGSENGVSAAIHSWNCAEDADMEKIDSRLLDLLEIDVGINTGLKGVLTNVFIMSVAIAFVRNGGDEGERSNHEERKCEEHDCGLIY